MVAPTVACAGLLLLHEPPPVASLSVVVCPTHTTAVPDMAAGVVFTVNVAVRKHPVPNVYVMVTVPAATPVTIPDDDPTVAVNTSLLLHVPPLVASVSVLVSPSHTLSVPPIAAGNAFTETVTVADPVQPALFAPSTVYVVLVVGLAVGLAHVVHDSPVAGDHE